MLQQPKMASWPLSVEWLPGHPESSGAVCASPPTVCHLPASRRPLETQLGAMNSRVSGPLFIEPCPRPSCGPRRSLAGHSPDTRRSTPNPQTTTNMLSLIPKMGNRLSAARSAPCSQRSLGRSLSLIPDTEISLFSLRENKMALLASRSHLLASGMELNQRHENTGCFCRLS